MALVPIGKKKVSRVCFSFPSPEENILHFYFYFNSNKHLQQRPSATQLMMHLTVSSRYRPRRVTRVSAARAIALDPPPLILHIDTGTHSLSSIASSSQKLFDHYQVPRRTSHWGLFSLAGPFYITCRYC